MKERIIYGLSGADGKIVYVGYTGNGLVYALDHQRSRSRLGTNTPVCVWIRENGEVFDGEVLEYLKPEDDAKDRVAYWSDYITANGGELLNVSSEQMSERLKKVFAERPELRAAVSRANKGRVVSEETRRRISESNKGKVISEAQRDAVRRTHTGKIVSEETRRKIAEKARGHQRNLGRVQSQETRDRMSYSKHLKNHVFWSINKTSCRWCENPNLKP